jgi:hypothetical protein
MNTFINDELINIICFVINYYNNDYIRNLWYTYIDYFNINNNVNILFITIITIATIMIFLLYTFIKFYNNYTIICLYFQNLLHYAMSLVYL